MRELIKAARNNRSIASNPDEEEMIEMTDQTKEEIWSILPKKCKCSLFPLIFIIATSGSSNFLLEKGTKPKRKKGVVRKFNADLSILLRNNEENKEE